MHFLLIFALIGVCLIVAPIVIEATLVVVFGLLGLLAFAVVAVVFWSLLEPFLPLLGLILCIAVPVFGVWINWNDRS